MRRQYTVLLLLTIGIQTSVFGSDDQKIHGDKHDLLCFKKPICPKFIGTNGARVTSNDDDPDDPDPNTLRGAILAANASDATACNPFVIVFELDQNNVMPNVITIADTPLPTILKPVCINGFTNTGASESKRILNVVLCNNNPMPNTLSIDGLTLAPAACGSTIKGLWVVGFDGISSAGIRVHAPHSLIAGNNIGNVSDTIETCKTDPLDNRNGSGVRIEFAPGVIVGGIEPGERNVISGNLTGLKILTDETRVIGNYFGTDETGRFGRPLTTVAIDIEGNSNIIGSEHPCGFNLISGNNEAMRLEGSSNTIINAIIGLDVTGKRALPNPQGGIRIEGTYNLITQSTISANNPTNIAIEEGAFNTVRCCRIGTDIHGQKSFSSDDAALRLGEESGGFLISTCVEDNLIANRNGIGIIVEETSFNTIRRNLIGSNCDETCSLGQNVGIKLLAAECPIFTSPDASALLGQKKSMLIPGLSGLPAHLKKVSGTCQLPCKECDHDLVPPGCCEGFASSSDATVKNCIEENVLVGNVDAGILISQDVRQAKIVRNHIGITKNCRILPNGFGVLVNDGAQRNEISCNVIAGNRINGIGIQGVEPPDDESPFTQTFQNSINKNSIFANCGSGIKLALNGNDCLPAPVIIGAFACDDILLVTIDPASLPGLPVLIELFGNTCCRREAPQGEQFLCSKTIQEPSDVIVLSVPRPCREIQCVTATVTELTSCFAEGNTSEFSCPVCIEQCVARPASPVEQSV